MLKEPEVKNLVKLLVMIAASGYLAYAAPPFQQASVTIQLTVQQSRFRVGEPVNLCVAMLNRGREAVKFLPMSLVTQTMRYWIRPGDRSFEPYELSTAKDPKPPLDLAAGGGYKAAELIHYNYGTGRLAFPSPGRYTIKAEYVEPLSVNPLPPPAEISVEVVAPEADEKLGQDLFSTRETADFLIGLSKDAGTRDRLANLIMRAPNSVYSLYARFYLAQYMATRYSDKPADLQGALRLITEANRPRFQLQPDTLSNLAEWSRQVGNTDASSSYIKQLTGDFPESCAAAKVQR